VGEGANDADVEKIERAILAGDEAERIIHMKTLYLGPDELLVAAKVAMGPERRLSEVSAATNAIEARIRDAVPIARSIYLEPDVDRGPDPEPPSTESIVITGLD
jgi:divalent metal cation (Fe/Co/Zn/Cd) transporter